jgi:hypothetical protein
VPFRPPPPTVSAAPAVPESPETMPAVETGISGVLLDARGVPLPHQAIVITTPYDRHGSLRIAFTDQYGAFQLRLAPALYHLGSSADDQSLDDIEIELAVGERLDGLELQLTAHRGERELPHVELVPDESRERDDDGPSDDRPPIKRRVIVIDPIVGEGDVDVLEPAVPETDAPTRARRLDEIIY